MTPTRQTYRVRIERRHGLLVGSLFAGWAMCWWALLLCWWLVVGCVWCCCQGAAWLAEELRRPEQ